MHVTNQSINQLINLFFQLHKHRHITKA